MHRIATTTRGAAESRRTAERVAALRQASRLREDAFLEGVLLEAINLPSGAPKALRDALRVAARALAVSEARGLLREWPAAAALVAGLEAETALAETFGLTLGRALSEALAAAPRQADGHAVTELAVPLIAFVRRPAELIARMLEACLSLSSDAVAGVGSVLAGQVRERLLKASGITEQAARDNPHRLKWPQGNEPGVVLVDRYLGTTPLAALLLTPVPLALTDRQRMEHMLITAGSGHGKTQTLQHLIVCDLARPSGQEVGLVVIDSQGDLIGRIARLERLVRAGRLVLVDPTDIDHPPALNLFDLGGRVGDARAGGAGGTLTPREREQLLNATHELYLFVFGGVLGADFTAKQAGIFLPVIELMLSIPGATILTLLEVMRDPGRFMGAIEKLPSLTRTFLTDRLQDKEFRQTRQQIEWRLNAVLMNGAFRRSFSAKANKVDLYQCLNAGKVVLINTAKEHLGEEGCRIFGRYMLALALKAAMDRARLPKASRRTSFLYVDEAADYFDGTVARLLSQARKYNVGCVLAHQALEQMSDSLRDLVFASTGIKLAGGVSAKDARALAAELRTTPEFILAQDKHEHGTRFATFVRSLTPAAISQELPFGTMEREPAIAESDAERRLAALRASVSSPATAENDHHDDAGDASDGDDDFSSRY